MKVQTDLKKDKKWKEFVIRNGNHLYLEYLMLWDRKNKADEMVKTHGELVASPNGFPVASPWLGVGNKCRSEILSIFKLVHGESSTKPLAIASDGKKGQAQARADAVTKTSKFAPSAAPLKVVK